MENRLVNPAPTRSNAVMLEVADQDIEAGLIRRVPAGLVGLSRRARASELTFVALAVGVGMAAGLATVVIGTLARTLQHWLFHLPASVRLSGDAPLAPAQLLVLPLGGGALALFSWAVRARARAMVDAIEANALHGGRMSLPDSAVVAGQTILSNGVGASVGLEAAYAQAGAMIGSLLGGRLKLRRADVRTLVGAGAGGAIAAAFGAPLAGAFYAFEVVIGAYTPSTVAPVVAASLAGAQVAQRLGITPYIVRVEPGPAIHTFGYLLYAGLGASCALLAITLMRGVALAEVGSRRLLPGWARPAVGGLALIPIVVWSPQVLSAGHSALNLDMADATPLAFIAGVLIAKSLASIVSLGFGFRGGLFFASLFLGTLVGHLYAGALAAVAGVSILNVGNAALVGMAALAVAVIGGPFTMTMLVLEATGNFSLTGAVLAAALVSSTLTRELFGYSFSTWRLHLRGETVKSARDVGWVRALTAGRLMRRGPLTAPARLTIAELRRRHPLGSVSRVVLVDEAERYAGIVSLPAAFEEGVDPATCADALAHATRASLFPAMDIAQVMAVFDAAQSDELAVLDGDAHVIGLVTEAYVRRRYAEEMDKAQRALFGER